jgi:urea carboxylase
MFHKVLIANRGEIACRIIRTLKRMGVITVAIYSEADIDALHKTSADIALPLGGFAAVDSYLKGDLILQLALDAGIDAIIPGYGFLSENFEFVDSCERAGVIFIGPTSEHIRNFGLKHLARHLSEQVGIPCTSGTGILSSATEAGDMSTTIGYPVILKNTAGGGGIGLAVCTSREEVIASYDGVQRIGEQQFSNGGVFLEQFIEVGRHVEVQIFGDGKGNIAVLGDRDCSIQRRNQKIIEECPAPNLSDSTRDKMHTCARKLGESVCYRSAGTVEFIYDLKSDKFYFLEVNTRIQVEHTVTVCYYYPLILQLYT